MQGLVLPFYRRFLGQLEKVVTIQDRTHDKRNEVIYIRHRMTRTGPELSIDTCFCEG